MSFHERVCINLLAAQKLKRYVNSLKYSETVQKISAYFA